MAKFRRSPLHAGRYLGRYICDHDNFFTTVLRNSRRKDRYVSRVRAMHGTYTASTKPKCVVIAKNRFPAISVLKCKFSTFGGPRAPLYNKKPLIWTRFTPIKFYWKLKDECNYVGKNLSPRCERYSGNAQSEKCRKWPLWQRIFNKLPEMKNILSFP